MRFAHSIPLALLIPVALALSPLSRTQAGETQAGASDQVAATQAAATASLTFDGSVALASLVALADGHFAHLADLLGVTALTEEARGGDWNRVKPLLADIQRRVGEVAIWYARPDGSYFTVDEDLVEIALTDRPYFPRVLSGETVIGELVVSRSAGLMSAIVAVPVRDGEAAVGVLGASVFMRPFGRRIARQMALSDRTIFFALNQDRRTAFNFRDERVFADPSDQGSESLNRAVDEMLARESGTVVYDLGEPRRVLFRRSAVTGWTYALGQPLD